MPVGPARAGMIRSAYSTSVWESGWPRTSGDDPHPANRAHEPVQLAPHERG